MCFFWYSIHSVFHVWPYLFSLSSCTFLKMDKFLCTYCASSRKRNRLASFARNKSKIFGVYKRLIEFNSPTFSFGVPFLSFLKVLYCSTSRHNIGSKAYSLHFHFPFFVSLFQFLLRVRMSCMKRKEIRSNAFKEHIYATAFPHRQKDIRSNPIYSK